MSVMVYSHNIAASNLPSYFLFVSIAIFGYQDFDLFLKKNISDPYYIILYYIASGIWKKKYPIVLASSDINACSHSSKLKY